MPLTFAAGEVPLASKLNRLVPQRVLQGFDQSATMETTLEDTSVVVPVTDLTKIIMEVRFESQGTGFMWAWAESGSVTSHSRTMFSPGLAATTGSTYNEISEVRFRSIFSLTESANHEHDSTSTAGRVQEVLVVEGDGELTFQFAKETSAPAATIFYGQSYALYQHLGS